MILPLLAAALLALAWGRSCRRSYWSGYDAAIAQVARQARIRSIRRRKRKEVP